MRNLISRAALAVGALALGTAGSNAAVVDSKTLNVQVSVAQSCQITAMGNITFDTINAGASTGEQTKSSAVTVACNSGSWYLTPASDGTAGVHDLSNGAATPLGYKLCSNNAGNYAGCTTLLSTSTTALTGSGNGSQTIYAVLRPGDTPTESGMYSDTVVIQLNN